MELRSSGAEIGDAPAVSTLEGVSTALLLCRKSLSIYPPGHPRLNRALCSLRERLLEYLREENEQRQEQSEASSGTVDEPASTTSAERDMA